MAISGHGVEVDQTVNWCLPGKGVIYLSVFGLMNWIRNITGGGLCKSGPRPRTPRPPPALHLYAWALIACFILAAVTVVYVGFVWCDPSVTRWRRRRKHAPTILWIPAPRSSRSSRSPRKVQAPVQPTQVKSPNKFRIQINVFNKDDKKTIKP